MQRKEAQIDKYGYTITISNDKNSYNECQEVITKSNDGTKMTNLKCVVHRYYDMIFSFPCVRIIVTSSNSTPIKMR